MELRYVSPGDLRKFAREALMHHGLSEEHADLVAGGLVSANLRGVDSHGVMRIPMYCERLRHGVVNPTPELKVIPVTAVAALVDGDNGMGFIIATRAMDEAIVRARQHGVGLVGVRNSNHFGMGALYVQQAIAAGCLGLVFTNASPAIPVWGGSSRFLGASPLAVGAPSGANSEPFLLDMAMTVIARGKVRLAAQNGSSIPPGIALDARGEPTTDPHAALEGVLLPFGGVKGAGLSFMMEILAGVLTGANFAGEVKNPHLDMSGPQGVGHLFMAIRSDLFMSKQEFGARMDTLVARAKSSPRAAGFDEILIPGEPEARTAKERERTGIPLTPDVIESLEREAQIAGIAMPPLSAVPLAVQRRVAGPPWPPRRD